MHLQTLAIKQLKRSLARKSLLDFILFCWRNREPFIVGKHTRAICDRITTAIDDYLDGKSTFLDIAVAFRHGKSEIVSIYLPAFFLGRCIERDPDVIMSGYASSLVEQFSRRCKAVIQSEEYKELFPGIVLNRGSNSVTSWSIEGSTGSVTVAGLDGSLTGKGGNLIIIDDYCKSRSEARSDAYRDKTWGAFQSDIMTRRAPVSIVIVCATPWHVDDLRGRIRKYEAGDPDFPKFEQLVFPARNEDGTFLFTERFSESWYREQYATLGKHASGLLDCAPVMEGGNRFNVDNIKIHDSLADFPQVRYVRAWDLASSSKERDKDDPDETVGLLGAVTTEIVDIGGGAKVKQQSLWIKDCVACHSEAPARNALILATAQKDAASGVPQYIEAFGAYKDAYTTLRDLLRGICVVRQSRLPGDKSAKASPLEPIFEAGNVHLMRGAWNSKFIDQFRAFPDGAHDDYCDPCAIIFDAFKVRSGVLDPNA